MATVSKLRITSSWLRASLLLVLNFMAPGSFAQTVRDVQSFFRDDVGLTEDQISDIRSGKAVAKAMPSRTPAELILFGAVHVRATPERYVKLQQDFNRLRALPNYLALGVFSNPPQLTDLKGFRFEGEEIKSLRDCTPGDCPVQMPASSIEKLQESVEWSAPDVDERVNEQLQRKALWLITAYQHEGNRVLGVYNDKRDPIDVAKHFEYLLSYSKVLPARLPQFYDYLLQYPSGKPRNTEDTFYWERVRFGLKPTLRIVQVTTMSGEPEDELACAIAEKQLYSSHYFETALQMSFCVRGKEDVKQRGFYLIMAMASEQAGFTGVKGAMIRKAAVGRSVTNLRNALTSIEEMLQTQK